MTNVDVVRAVYAAFERGDLPELLSRLDPEVEWRLAESHPYSPEGERWVGHQEIVGRFFKRAADDWDDFRVHVGELHDAGQVVVVQVRYSGRSRASERQLDAQGCHLWRVRSGKVTSFEQYVDTARLERAFCGPRGQGGPR